MSGISGLSGLSGISGLSGLSGLSGKSGIAGTGSDIIGTNNTWTGSNHFTTVTVTTSSSLNAVSASSITSTSANITSLTLGTLIATTVTATTLNSTNTSIENGICHIRGNIYYPSSDTTYTQDQFSVNQFIEMQDSGKSSYTITLPDPTKCAGQMIHIWCNGSQLCYISNTGGAYFKGKAPGSYSTFPPLSNMRLTLMSDYYNWIVLYADNNGF